MIFKQLLQAQALSYVQVDSCRLGSVNENLSVLLMAKKFQGKALENSAVEVLGVFSGHFCCWHSIWFCVC